MALMHLRQHGVQASLVEPSDSRKHRWPSVRPRMREHVVWRRSTLCACLTRPSFSWETTVAAAANVLGDDTLHAQLLAEMAQKLRVYLYEQPAGATPAKNFTGQNRGYGMERVFAQRLASSHMRVDDGFSANLFWLPLFPAAMRFTPTEEQLRTSRTVIGRRHRYLSGIQEEVRRVVTHLAATLPFLARRNGSDHFWVSGADDGKAAAASTPLLANAIALANTGDQSARERDRCQLPADSPHGRWRAANDVATVPHVIDATFTIPRADSLAAIRSRRIGVFFAGILAHGPGLQTRGQLMRAFAHHRWTLAPGLDTRIAQGHIGAHEYRISLSNAVFCLAPRGNVVWSPRLVDAILFGCIPVVISDDYWLPHSCFVDWRAFSVRVREHEANLLPTLLSDLYRNATHLERMHAALRRVRHAFVLEPHRRPSDNREEGHGFGADAFELHMVETYMRSQGCAQT